MPAYRAAAAAFALFALCTAVPAHAQPRTMSAGDGLADDERRPGVALGLSLGGTAAGLGTYMAMGAPDAVTSPGLLVGLVGVTFGPSVGRWYAGELRTRGLYVRLGGLSLGVAGLMSMSACEDEVVRTEFCSNRVAKALLIAGTSAVAIGAIDDIVTAPRAVTRRNQRVRAGRIRLVSVAPSLRGGSLGVAVSGRF